MKLNSKFLLATLLVSVMGIFSINVVATSSSTLNIIGSTTVLPIAQRASELFMQAYPNYSVTIKGGGSSVGITSLINGTCDIADASRPMQDEEVKMAQEKGVNPVEFAIAKDGIAMIVHPSNPQGLLTFEQIANIYTDPKISNWKALGGPDRRLVVVSRDTTSGTYESFLEMVIQEVKGKGARLRPDTIYVGSNAEMAETVAGTEGAIGYIGMGYLSGGLKTVRVSAKGETYTSPTLRKVREGVYPISRSLYMYIDGKKTNDGWEPTKPIIAKWLDFIYSYTGQCVVKEQGYVPLYHTKPSFCEFLFKKLKAKYLG